MQKIVVIGIIILAALFLFRKAKFSLDGKGGCSNGCGCKDKKPDA